MKAVFKNLLSPFLKSKYIEPPRKISINGEVSCFYPLDYYDGTKQEVNSNKNILLLWYSYKENGELWLLINGDLTKYLKNKEGLLSLINKSQVKVVFRDYENFNTISKNNFRDISIVLPDDIPLGFSFLSFKQKIITFLQLCI